MVINQDVQNLVEYPGNVKRVTLDVTTTVPTGTEGDEKMMLTASTSAYSDIEARTNIQSLYIMEGNIGWAKSSGLAGSGGKFALDATHHNIGINMDATVSGTYTYGNKNYYEISLDYNNDNTPKAGEDIAIDIQDKLRAIVCGAEDAGFQLAYTNCSVKFESGKFYISSGTIGSTYSGPSKSSVAVAPAPTYDCSAILGFDHTVTSEELDGTTVMEVALLSDYTAGSSTMYIGNNSGVQPGDSLYITDGTNFDYFTVITASGTILTVPTVTSNGFIGVTNSYTLNNGSFVQILRRQDPDVRPNAYYKDTDELLRYMAKCLINQIDFSG